MPTSLPVISQELIEEILSLVSPEDAEVIRLRHLDRLPAADVAEILHIAPAAVDQRVSRAVRRLRQAVGGRPDLVEELQRPHPRNYAVE